MCRLYGLLANEPTKVECTLVHAQNALLHQSRSDLRGHTHSDGWGIGCYANSKPTCERRATAAHEDLWFSATAERTYSQAVVAHVRRATVGNPSLENSHPFVYGCWTFAHNGTLANFKLHEHQLAEEISSSLLGCRHGSTDSELIFLWLLSLFENEGISLRAANADASRSIEIVSSALSQLESWSAEITSEKMNKLNFVLTNGEFLLATRWNHTLYYTERIGVHDCEICGIPHIQHARDHEYRACVVASEPISDEPWKLVPNHSILLADSKVRPCIYPAD
ncbi:MAG: class II glutamine amidotransferase [Lacipirellulaceae bacterium]